MPAFAHFDAKALVRALASGLGQFVDEGEAVAQGDDDLLDARVLLDVVVEGDDAAGLGLALCLGVYDLAGPQGVVGDDETAWFQVFHHQVVVLDILALVGVDEHEVVALAQRGNDVAGIADVQAHALAVGRQGQVFADEVLLLVVDLDGVDAAVVVGQTLGQAQRRIAAEGAQFQHAARLYHSRQHLDQAPLQVPRAHVPVVVLHVGVVVDACQRRRLLIDMPQDIFL